jgi:Tol biopolymer transport system component
MIARLERVKSRPRYGVFRAGAAPRWQPVDDTVLGAEFAPGCALVAETYYAFSDDRESDGGVLIRETGGEEVMRLQSHSWPDGETLAWSRDGTRLAVTMNHRNDRLPGIRVVDVRSRRVLARHATDAQLTPEAFSPDGGALVYEFEGSLRVLDVATGKARVLAGADDGRRLRAPAWSPKGDRIAAVNDGGGIELLDPALGYGPTLRTAKVWTESLAWAPDGRALALQFLRPNSRDPVQRYGLGVVAATPTGRLRRLVEPTRDLSPPVWSPDGTALAVTRRG